MTETRRVAAVGHEHRLAVDGQAADRATDRRRCGSRADKVRSVSGDLAVFVCAESGREIGREEERT